MSFSAEKMQNLKDEIKKALSQLSHPPIAAFDADGTLWSNDLGEQFFQYQIDQKLLPKLPADPWRHYFDLKEEVSPQVAYLWLAQINAGFPLDEVRSWAKASVEANSPTPVFKAQQEIISFLHEQGVKVYIVTASCKWAVEPAAHLFDIPMERVVGIETEVIEGVVGEKQFGPITYREGKVEGLLKATGGVPAFYCAGNTEGDLPLLESATHLRFVMASAADFEHNFETEQMMVEIARERGWMYHCVER